MASQLQLRRGTTVQHGSFIGAPAEVTVDTDKKTVVVHDGTTAGGFPVLSASGGTMTGPVSMGGSKITSLATPTAPADAAPKGYVDGLVAAATLADADYGDITVSGGATVWTIDNNAVTAAKIASGAVTSDKIADGTIVDADIANDTITNAKIKSDAAIAGTKIAPNFGSQNVATTGAFRITGTKTTALINYLGTQTIVTPDVDDWRTSIRIGSASYTAPNVIEFWANNAQRALIDTSGNIGIGTSSPTQQLHVARSHNQNTEIFLQNTDAGAFASATMRVTQGSVNALLQAFGGVALVGTVSSHPMIAITNSLERLRIDASGNVGIGTTSPAYLLDANGTVNTSDAYRVDGTQVVSNRRTGWAAPTGTATRTAFATSTVTTAQLAERVKALIDDLTTHGLIGA